VHPYVLFSKNSEVDDLVTADIYARGIPGNVVAVRPLVRNITHNPGVDFQPVKDSLGNDVAYTFLDDANGGNSDVRLTDRNLREDMIYEYCVEMMLDSGVLIRSLPFRDKTDVNPYSTNEQDVTITIKSTPTNNKFLLSLKRSKTELDKVLDALTVKEFEFYKDDLKKIRQAAKTFLRARIYFLPICRDQSKMSAYRYVGDYRDGATFSIQHFGSEEVIFKIKPYDISPLQFVDSLQNLLRNIEERDSSAPLSGVEKSILLKAKKDVKKIAKNNGKFFNYSFRRKGIIDFKQPDLKSINTFSAEENDFGYCEYVTKSIRKTAKQGALSVGNVRLFRDIDGHMRVKFQLTSTAASNNEIDFLAVCVTKNGITYPVCPLAVQSKMNQKIFFMDYTNVDFKGTLTYYIKPVFEDGSVGNSVYLCKQTIL
jgi:hypothetical protein